MFTFIIILLLLTLSVLAIDTTNNLVQSAVYLVVTFVLSAISLTFHSVDYFVPLLIIVYVGAITVLILFVIMVLRIKESANVKVKGGIIYENFDIILAGILLSFTIYYGISTGYLDSFSSGANDLFITDLGKLGIRSFDDLSLLQSLSQYLYNVIPFVVLLVGIYLLVALFGSLVLAQEVNSSKTRNESVVFSRDSSFLSLFTTNSTQKKSNVQQGVGGFTETE